MDKQPKIVEDVQATPAAKQSTQLQALVEQMQEAQGAINVADAAPAVEVEVDGKTVKHLNIRLSSHETLRVMSLPVEERARMATQILKERRIASDIRKDVEREQAVAQRARKKARKAKAKARRRNR